MNSPKNENSVTQEEAIKQKLGGLKYQIANIHDILPCMQQCSCLSNLLQILYEIRAGINQLEQSLLKTHVKCCISPDIKVPGEVGLAVSNLSANHNGAIIVIEQENNLDEYLKDGVIVEAIVNAPILENIFYPGSPLHDGAVIIRNTRIIKAGVLLPLAPYDLGLEALGLGTRHRAALGLSQLSDALVIVVSEEKGWISFALLQKFENTSEEETQYIK